MGMKKQLIKYLHCLRCGYDWIPRGFARPKACPECKSRAWDEKRVEQAEEQKAS